MVDAVMTTFIQYLQTVVMRVSQLGPLDLTYGMIATRGRKRRATTAAHETTSSVVMSVGTRAFFGVAFEPFAATAATAFPIGETEKNRSNRQYSKFRDGTLLMELKDIVPLPQVVRLLLSMRPCR